MAILAIAAVGAGIGWGAYGTAAAATLGWNLGMTAGGILFAPKMPNQYGPRLGDLKVQASTYGNPIPIVYGTMRVAGNMIWAADIVETAHENSSGGKGGGGGGSYTSYTYSQSFAVAICEGEIAGIRKIWANGKLIYNLSDTADIATIVASNQSAAGIRIYTGSETQTADSLIEAYVGAADTPAYRGIAYIVFENLQLADYGNRTPNLEFEVVDNGGELPGLSYVGEVADTIDGRTVSVSGSTLYVMNTYGSNTLQSFSLSSPLVPTLIGSLTTGSTPSGNNVTSSNPYAYVANVHSNTVQVISAIAPSAMTSLSTIALSYPYAMAFYNDMLFVGEYYGNLRAINVQNKSSPSITATTSVVLFDKPNTLAANSDYVFVANAAAVEIRNHALNLIASVSMPSPVFVLCLKGNYIYALLASGKLSIIDVTSAHYPTIASTIDNAMGSNASALVVDDTYAYAVATGGTTRLQVFDITTKTSPVSVETYTSGAPSEFLLTSIAIYQSCIYCGDYGDGNVKVFRFTPGVITETATTLSSIVSNICTRAGLTAGQIDVTALTDTVHGYVVQRGTARSQLEQLMQAFYFDAVESDGKVKFVKRGGSSVVSIPEDDLAAHEYGSSPPDTLVTSRRQEMELPVEVDVQYMDSGAAYAIGSQYTARLTTESENKSSQNFAIAMTATKAKQIADVLMYDAWTSRTSFDFQTGWKYCYLEPTDVITITKGGRSYIARIVDEDFAITSRRQAVLEDSSVYTQTATAAGLPVPSEIVTSAPLTNLMLLDIPLLRDADDGYGFYAAACGYSDGWTGAQPFKSNDGGATWTSFGAGILNAATIGTASTALGDFTQNIFDELNSVTVVLLNGTLSSDTEINILNGANAALVGNEIIQFRDATLTATNTYKLTGLLRGRQGTEWARSTHAIGDRFVLFTTTTIYPMWGSVSEYDLDRQYRGVSFGGFLDDATTITFQNTAVQAIPYSPVHLGGGRNAAGDLTLTWIRRTRISGGWNNYSDVPLGESTEAYVVEIYNNSGYASVVRTISGITSATTSYTAAQQTTDFGSPQATVHWKVYQVSATVGNGYEARGVT